MPTSQTLFDFMNKCRLLYSAFEKKQLPLVQFWVRCVPSSSKWILTIFVTTLLLSATAILSSCCCYCCRFLLFWNSKECPKRGDSLFYYLSLSVCVCPLIFFCLYVCGIGNQLSFYFHFELLSQSYVAILINWYLRALDTSLHLSALTVHI